MPVYTYKSASDTSLEKRIISSTGIIPEAIKLTPVRQIAVVVTDPLRDEQKNDLDIFMLDNDFVFDSVV